MMRSFFPVLAVLFGAALEVNGVFMLASPESWYFAVPGVTSTGPFNQHFLRDIGLIFLFLGGAFLAGVGQPQLRVLLWVRPHDLVDRPWPVPLLGGGCRICSPSVVHRDFPAVTLPAIIGDADLLGVPSGARRTGSLAGSGSASALAHPLQRPDGV